MASSIKTPSAPPAYELYVAGDNPLSRRALANLHAFIDEVGGPRDIRVVDVLADPTLALEKRIFATPALVVATGATKPLMIVGDLADRKVVLDALKPLMGGGA